MVKGISRQVIVVEHPDKDMFEQAIFILKDGQKEVTDDMLWKEAKRLVGSNQVGKGVLTPLREAIWFSVGALTSSALWLIFTCF